MKGRPIDALVYEQIFKTPKSSDCQNFNALLQRQLVPEVRLETAAFYGNLDTKEAQYPGLDYSYPPHRMRLSRFTWHRRLFRAFDNLGLTKAEIASLTKWEGTRWAKERFEKEQGIIIEDTTCKEIEDWVEQDSRDTVMGREEGQDIEVEEMEDVEEEEGEVDEDDAEEESDMESIGIELNERLRARAALRNMNSIPESESVDEEFEQWMKENLEGNEHDLGATSNSFLRNAPSLSSPRPQARLSSTSRQMDGHQTLSSATRAFTTTSSFPASRGPIPGRMQIMDQPQQALPPRS